MNDIQTIIKMKRLIFFIGLLLLISFLATAQEQPTVIFPPGSNVCDPTPYKLVFDEEFNGIEVDRTKWVTYNTWNGNEYDGWDEGRWDWEKGQTIMRDKNVVIGGGIAKLQVYHEAQYWKCDTCPMGHHTNYSSGRLTTRYSQHYNNGKFEARIKLPRANHMWSTMWTYHGAGVNEIDIVEAHGGPQKTLGENNYIASYSFHAQKPDSPKNNPYNPYNLQDGNVTRHYPHNDWWDIVKGTFMTLDEWHTYTCEWDTALVSTYLDGSLINQEPKYFYYHSIPVYQHLLFWSWQTGTIQVYHPAICAVAPGETYHITKWFPYKNNSQSILRFTTQMDKDMTGNVGAQGYTGHEFVGEMQIDYARIWQRHPEQDNHTNICDNNPSVTLTGPSIVCNTATYTVSASPYVPNGVWSFSSNFNMISQSATATTKSITVQQVASSTSSSGSITYTSDIPGCPGGVATKLVDVGPPKGFSANIVKVNLYSGQSFFYDLFASNPYPNTTYSITGSPTTYHWDLYYTTSIGAPPFGSTTTNHFIANGQHVSTPVMGTAPGSGDISGTLTITNACGSAVIRVKKPNAFGKGTADSTREESGGEASYYNADIKDTAAYRMAVESDIQNQFVPDTLAEDTAAVKQIIEKAITRALAPYIILDSTTMEEGARASNSAAASSQDDDTKVFPNPTSGEVSIVLGMQFDLSKETTISVADLYGRQLLSRTFDPASGNALQLSITSLSAGVYSVSVKQGEHSRRFLVTKQ